MFACVYVRVGVCVLFNWEVWTAVFHSRPYCLLLLLHFIFIPYYFHLHQITYTIVICIFIKNIFITFVAYHYYQCYYYIFITIMKN